MSRTEKKKKILAVLSRSARVPGDGIICRVRTIPTSPAKSCESKRAPDQGKTTINSVQRPVEFFFSTVERVDGADVPTPRRLPY